MVQDTHQRRADRSTIALRPARKRAELRHNISRKRIYGAKKSRTFGLHIELFAVRKKLGRRHELVRHE
jgi:hypothetical protein